MKSSRISGVDKAATLMIALNKEVVSKVFALLEDDEIKEISQAMTNLGPVSGTLLESLIIEFNKSINASLSFVGNLQNTERLLRTVLGKDKVDVILEDIRGPAGKNIWDKLGNVNEETLANYLKNEYPQTVALILSRLQPAQSAKVLASVSNEFAFEIIKRMLSMDSVKKEVLDKIEKTLRNEFVSNLTKTQKSDNNQVIAEIFNNLDRTNEAKFMSLLEGFNQDAADKVKRLMFTFNDIMRVDSFGMQAVLKTIDKTYLPKALKGTAAEIRKKFMDCMSQRAAKILQEEIDSLGPIRLKDVDEAQMQIIVVIKELVTKGEIELSDNNETEQLIY